LIAFNSFMLSSELTDQKQININESFCVNEENGAFVPRIGFSIADDNVVCASEKKETETNREMKNIFL
jgi:hypothetical protein